MNEQINNLTKKIWAQNPVFYLALGLCPALAVTNSFTNALAMSLAVLFVLLCTNICLIGIRRHIPSQVKILVFLVIAATFTTVADIFLKANFPLISKALGPYLPLAAVNCILLSRAEIFNLKYTPLKSLTDTLGLGTGFLLAMLLLGSFREIIGSGSIMGFNIFGNSYEPWIIMFLPAGALLSLGLLTGIFNLLNRKK